MFTLTRIERRIGATAVAVAATMTMSLSTNR